MEELNIDISLSQNVNIGDGFALYLKDEIGANYNVIADFVELRTGRYQVALGSDLNATINNLKTALILDHGSAFDIVGDISGIKMKSKLPNWSYVGELKKPVNLPILFTPELVPKDPFKITKIEFQPAPENQCSHVKVLVTANKPITSYCINKTCNQVISQSTVGFLYYRGSIIDLDIVSGQNWVSTKLKIPSPIEIDSNPIVINIFKDSSGGAVTIHSPFPEELNYEYSLDRFLWYPENTFSGLSNGDYTLYIRDQYGCQKTKPFSILEQNFGSPVVFLSKENSLRFMEPKTDYSKDENRTYCDSPAKLNYGYMQQFLKSDIITTQFKSNYNLIEVTVKDIESGDSIFIPVNKMTNNIGIKVKYNQVKKYKISESQFGIYFETGQVLDYDSNALIDTYNLNGSLPAWAKLGNVVQIDGAFYTIDNIAFDENVNAEVLVFNGVGPSSVQNAVVSCVYNIQDYEVYEFLFDFFQFNGKIVQVQISNSDPNFGNYNWISEQIEIVEQLEGYLEIRYYNSTNTNVLYSTGITHLLRIPFNTIKANDSESSENYNTDTNTHLLNSKVYEGTDFEFLPMPLELFRKVKIALSMDTVFIDAVGYTKNGEFQKENLGSTNLYKLTAPMIKNGFVFNSNMNNSENISDNPLINIPGLIELTSDGYVKL